VQICNQYSEFVVPFLLMMFNEIARESIDSTLQGGDHPDGNNLNAAQTSIDLASVVHKEALYCAIARCAAKMKEVIPFNEWLEHTLASEARDTNPK
jgi:hypothetical protein